MATHKQTCCFCDAAPSIRWPGAPICKTCFDAQQTTAQNPPPKVDAAEAALIRHGELCALEGRLNTMGLSSIAAPADALAAEIARGRLVSETLH